MDAYADWLVTNQNKKGTPELQTVANAYKSMRQKEQTTTQDASERYQLHFCVHVGYRQTIENIGTTLQATGVAPEFGRTSRCNEAPQNYESASDRFINPKKVTSHPRWFCTRLSSSRSSRASRKPWWITNISRCRCYSGRYCNWR